MCQFTMTPDEGSSDGSAWTLPQTPVVWHVTVVKSFMPSSIEEESGMVTLHVRHMHLGDVSSDWGHIVPAKFVNDGLMQCRVPPAPKPMYMQFWRPLSTRCC